MNLKEVKSLIKNFKPEPTGIKFLDERFEEMRNPQGYVAPYYRFFYQLVKEFKPPVIVELGSWQGTSAAHFAAGCPDSSIITVDHHTDPGDRTNKALTISAEIEFENLTYCQGWTCSHLFEEEKDCHAEVGQNAYPKVLKALNKRKIDLLFIDSWHRYDQAVKDWYAYSPLLKKGALVICDDIIQGSEGAGIENMTQFWEERNGDKFLDTSLHSGYPMGFLCLKN